MKVTVASVVFWEALAFFDDFVASLQKHLYMPHVYCTIRESQIITFQETLNFVCNFRQSGHCIHAI